MIRVFIISFLLGLSVLRGALINYAFFSDDPYSIVTSWIMSQWIDYTLVLLISLTLLESCRVMGALGKFLTVGLIAIYAINFQGWFVEQLSNMFFMAYSLVTTAFEWFVLTFFALRLRPVQHNEMDAQANH